MGKVGHFGVWFCCGEQGALPSHFPHEHRSSGIMHQEFFNRANVIEFGAVEDQHVQRGSFQEIENLGANLHEVSLHLGYILSILGVIGGGIRTYQNQITIYLITDLG